MKYAPLLAASCFLSALSAATTATAPATETCATPYFLDCRSVMGELYADLLFLQPNGSSLYYAAEAIPLDQSISGGAVNEAVSPNWKIFELSPNYTPAFKIGGKALFSATNTVLEASWERLRSHKTASKTLSPTADGGALMIGPISDIGPNSAAYTKAHGKVDFQFDAVNLVFGQSFCAFKRLYPTFFAGAGFARIQQHLRSSYSNVAETSIRKIKTESTFIGAGPQFGCNFDYRIVAGFFFTGSSSIELMMGELKNTASYQSDAPYLVSQGIAQPNRQHTSIPHRVQLIPGFEEKLGFSYSGVFKCCKVTFGAGYQAQIYLNAVQTIDMTAPQVPPSVLPDNVPDSGMYAVGFERTLSNFILTGPYINLNIEF